VWRTIKAWPCRRHLRCDVRLESPGPTNCVVAAKGGYGQIVGNTELTRPFPSNAFMRTYQTEGLTPAPQEHLIAILEPIAHACQGRGSVSHRQLPRRSRMRLLTGPMFGPSIFKGNSSDFENRRHYYIRVDRRVT
jgi:hypothetical protein